MDSISSFELSFLVFGNLSLFFGWFVNLFLSYEIFVIEFFGKINISPVESLSIPLVIIYYLIIIVFIFYTRFFRLERAK